VIVLKGAQQVEQAAQQSAGGKRWKRRVGLGKEKAPLGTQMMALPVVMAAVL
jgi:hypothetical protein